MGLRAKEVLKRWVGVAVKRHCVAHTSGLMLNFHVACINALQRMERSLLNATRVAACSATADVIGLA
jgi:hypothetical protein